MKTYDEEYTKLFEKFTETKEMLQNDVDMRSEKMSDWFYDNFVTKYNTLYDWTEMEFTILNSDNEDIESLLDDLRDNKCETFADFSLHYMSQYVDKLRKFKETKEE